MSFCLHASLYRRRRKHYDHRTNNRDAATAYNVHRKKTRVDRTYPDRPFGRVHFIFDACMKLIKLPIVVQATMQAGYPESTIVGIGITLFACTLLYLIPRTSIFGAVLLTGYLGAPSARRTFWRKEGRLILRSRP